MKNKRTTTVGVFCVCIIFIIAAFWCFTAKKLYYVKADLDRNVVALWNSEEVFIFIGKRIEGATGSPTSLLLKGLRSTMSYQPEHERGDLILIHVKGNACNKHVFENFGPQGTPYPVHGSVYYERLTNQAGWPALWRWGGTDFEKVDTTEARTMLKSLPLLNELMAKEGWNLEHLFLTSDGKSLLIRTRSEQFNLVITLHTANLVDSTTVSLNNRSGNSSVEILAQGSSEYKRVSQAQYWETFKHVLTGN